MKSRFHSSTEHDSCHQEKMIGYIYTSLAYLLWGFLGLYWNALETVSPLEILAHRILWGFVFIFTIMIFQSNKRFTFFTLLKEYKVNFKQFLYFFVASLAISGNWLIFIWAVIYGPNEILFIPSVNHSNGLVIRCTVIYLYGV